MKNLPFSLWLIVLVMALPNLQAQNEPRLIVRSEFIEEIPVLVRVELRTPSGAFDRSVWDAEAVLTSDNPAVTITPNTVTLRNGCGSALVTFGGATDFSLIATVNGVSTNRFLEEVGGNAQTEVSGTLTGDATTWSGIINVTGDVTIPAGHTLTVNPGTLVLIDGVASGTSAPDIFVRGRIESLGTSTAPVTFTCSDSNLRWGQIDHNDAEDSLYQYTIVSRAGRAAGEGHTGQAPAIDCSGSTIRFENCTIADHAETSRQSSDWGKPGKIMQASGGSDLVFDECLLTRSRMGPEITGTAILFRNSYIIDMTGDDDADAIYIHSQGAGQIARIEGSVIAGADDDGVDTLGSRVTVHDTYVRDVADKGMSVLGNEVHVSHCLSANCGIGLSSKASNGATVTTRIWNSTIYGKNRGIAAENKNGGAPDATVRYFVTNSIIQATVRPDSTIYTDYDPANISLSYSLTANALWPGVGNITGSPQFVAPTSNFHLQSSSPCIDAGDPGSALDPDGTRADMGAFPSTQVPLRLINPAISATGETFSFQSTGREGDVVEIQATENFQGWQSLGFGTNEGGDLSFEFPTEGYRERFFRALLLP